jgi:hypothetical protein
LKSHLIPETLEAADEPALHRLAVALVEGVGAEVAVGLVAAEDVGGDHQDRVRERDDGLLGAAPGG